MKYIPLLTPLLLLASNLLIANTGLHVYDDVLDGEDYESPHYSFKVRKMNPVSAWETPFAFLTKCTPPTLPKTQTTPDVDKYYSEWIGNWSNTYINFELAEGTNVEIEITKLDDGSEVAITDAEVLPANACRHAEIRNGKVYVIIDRPTMFTVDIDEQLDQQTAALSTQWGTYYNGPPIHTLTVFANPVLESKPSKTDPGVLVVDPDDTQIPAHDGPWTTLYFDSGVHDIGLDFKLHDNKNYYIPGDAIVRGTLNNNGAWGDADNVRIFGHGTLTGEGITHPKDVFPTIPSTEYYKYRPIEISGANNTTVEGITIADAAYHSVNIFGGYDVGAPSYVKWVKIFTWRANGDGVYPGHNTYVEDCFIRAQDDSIYTLGRAIRRCLFWNDVNGSAFVLTPLGNIQNPDLIVEDCDVLYNRGIYTPGQTGGAVFNLRGLQQQGELKPDSILTFRNIRVLEKYPNSQAFLIQTAAPYTKAPEYNDSRVLDAAHVRFENIHITAESFLGYSEVLWGTEDAVIDDFVFNNVFIAGEEIDGIDHFHVNDYETGIQFQTWTAETIAFNNTATDFKWETTSNWQSGNSPDYLDAVEHKSIPGTLTLESVQHIASLEVSNNGGASLELLPSGSLTVSGNIEIGNSGPTGQGSLLVKGGDLTVAGNLEFGIYGPRYGYGEIDNGLVTTYGKVNIGGWNPEAVGEVEIRGFSTWTHDGEDLFYIGRHGPGTLTMNGGTIDITSTGNRPLRIGQFDGVGTLNMNWGKIYTSGLIMGKTGSSTGYGIINLNGGSITIDSENSNSLQVHGSSHIHLEPGGGILIKGDHTGTGGLVDTLIGNDNDKITCPGGVTPNVFYDQSTGYTNIWGAEP